MTGPKQIIDNSLVSTARENNSQHQTWGVVYAARDKENVCDIGYRDKNGYWRNLTNIEVDSPDREWFPGPGEYVVLNSMDENHPVITRPQIRDYMKDVMTSRYDMGNFLTKGSCTVRGKMS